jgi:hypothetical protein
MNIFERHGGTVQNWDSLHSLQEFLELWQLHMSGFWGADHNMPDNFIANLTKPRARSDIGTGSFDIRHLETTLA